MSTERWERTKQILEEALRLARDQRQAYLDRACGSDGDLRADVESLVASHDAAGSQFLAAAAPDIFHLPAPAWGRRGVASDQPISVRALAYIIVGHVRHHLEVLTARYGA